MTQIWRKLKSLFGGGERPAADDAAMIEALFASDIAGVALADLTTGKFIRVKSRTCEI